MQNNNYIPEDFEERNQFIINLLYELLQSPYWNKLIFKGWTMMTLFLWSERFSEDLDFNVENVKEWLKISEWIYQYLLNKWYNLGELYKDWTNVYNIEVFYNVNWNEYTCQVEIFKDDFWVETKYYTDTFLWKNIKIMSLKQSFAHKCCAYIERWDRTIPRSGRPKWRDLFDILHYIKMDIVPDLEIIYSRLNIDNLKDFFTYIYQRIVVKHYKKWDEFDKEIINFAYNKISWYDIIEELLKNINRKFLNNKIDIDIYYLFKLDNLAEDNWKFNLTEDIRCRYNNWLYELIDLDFWKVIYNTKDLSKLKKYIENNIWRNYYN